MFHCLVLLSVSGNSRLHATRLVRVKIQDSQDDFHKVCVAIISFNVNHSKLGTIWFLRLSGINSLLYMVKSKLRDISLFCPQRRLYLSTVCFFLSSFMHQLYYIRNSHGCWVSFRFAILVPC